MSTKDVGLGWAHTIFESDKYGGELDHHDSVCFVRAGGVNVYCGVRRCMDGPRSNVHPNNTNYHHHISPPTIICKVGALTYFNFPFFKEFNTPTL